jgi:rRNA maturation protein Nop10
MSITKCGQCGLWTFLTKCGQCGLWTFLTKCGQCGLWTFLTKCGQCYLLFYCFIRMPLLQGIAKAYVTVSTVDFICFYFIYLY